MQDTQVSTAGKTDVPGPEPKTPPQAKSSSGSESGTPVTGPRKRSKRIIEGEELRCTSCNGFLAVVQTKPFKGVIRCHRCKTMNSFVFE